MLSTCHAVTQLNLPYLTSKYSYPLNYFYFLIKVTPLGLGHNVCICVAVLRYLHCSFSVL